VMRARLFEINRKAPTPCRPPRRDKTLDAAGHAGGDRGRHHQSESCKHGVAMPEAVTEPPAQEHEAGKADGIGDNDPLELAGVQSQGQLGCSAAPG